MTMSTTGSKPAADIHELCREPFLVLVVLILPALVFASTLGFEFAYDDEGQILENIWLRSWHYVPKYFSGQVWQYFYPQAPGNYYRPLNLLWFRLNYAWFADVPAPWHALTVLLHLGVVFLAYLTARRLTGKPFVAAMTALFFAVHPMRHEVVAWVSGTTESLWCLFFFAAFLAYLTWRRRRHPGWMALSCGFYAAALLAKETALVLPAVVFAHAWIYGDEDDANAAQTERKPAGGSRSALLCSMAYLPVAVAYVAVRDHVLHGFSHPQVPVSAATFVLTLPSALFFYFRQWVLPIHMSEFYELPLLSAFSASHVLLPLAGVLAVGGLVWIFRRELGAPLVTFASAWMVLTLLPALDFAVFPPGELVHDRYFYLPSFGVALLMSLAIARIPRGSGTLGIPLWQSVCALAILVPWSCAAFTASGYWVNSLVLFDQARRIAPHNVTVRNNYAVQVARSGSIRFALPLAKELVRDHPENWLANYNYARLSYQLGDLDTARRYFERAEGIDGRMPDTYLQLGLVAIRTGRLPDAEASVRHAVALRPDVPKYHFALGVVLADERNCDAAKTEFAQTLELQPGFPRAAEQIDKCQERAAADGAQSEAGRP